MSKYFAYIRVSTAKQGEKGVSLQEQREAITRYASQRGITIVRWFEERETAAKRGRPLFGQMLTALKRQKVRGLLVHKIDRSARNLRDWADLGDLIDKGVDVHFVNESLDLQSRGGRLSADIQAVVAADYIRNLREETRKGFYGRLKQGLYPIPAPIGYVDQGRGKPKTIDPIAGPLVRKAFELYASGRYNLLSLRDELARRGLRNRNGKPVTRNGIATMLHNPFYIGLVRIKKTRELFQGIHEPLISKSLFDRVQRTMQGKSNTREIKHGFLFRRLVHCKLCGYALVGERQKGHIYYRCHTPSCLTTGIRQEAIEAALISEFRRLEFSDSTLEYFRRKIGEMSKRWAVVCISEKQTLQANISKATARLARLTDAFLDGSIERELFDERKSALLLERKDLEEKLRASEVGVRPMLNRVISFLELAKSATRSYFDGSDEEKRDLVSKLTSNRVVDQKSVVVTLSSVFSQAANWLTYRNGDPFGDTPRSEGNLPRWSEHEVFEDMIGEICEWVKESDARLPDHF